MIQTITHIALFLLLSISSLNAQINLIPNPSFEENDSCPTMHSGIDPFCSDWFTPIGAMQVIPPPYSNYGWGTSDYFHVCSTDPKFGVPYNRHGYQMPVHGDAYAGFMLLTSSAENGQSVFFREYVEVELKQKLTRNYLYNFELYFSITGLWYDLDPNLYQSITIEALLTDTMVYRYVDSTTANYVEDIEATAILSHYLPVQLDTVSWHKMSYNFRASGNEKFLTIGNFDDVSGLSHSKSIYVYVDAISLTYVGEDTTPIPEPLELIIYPNPTNDFITIKQENGNLKGISIEIYDMTGRLVSNLKIISDVDEVRIPVFQFATGMYYCILRKENKQIEERKITIIK
jgi:hypothetical protein